MIDWPGQMRFQDNHRHRFEVTFQAITGSVAWNRGRGIPPRAPRYT